MTLILLIVLLALYFHFEPSIDRTEEGWLLWYNKYGRRNSERTFKKLN